MHYWWVPHWVLTSKWNPQIHFKTSSNAAAATYEKFQADNDKILSFDEKLYVIHKNHVDRILGIF